MKQTTVGLTRGRRFAIRVVGAIGVVLFAFLSIVALNVLGVVPSGTEGSPDDPAPSAQARYGAAHPGEAVHAVGAVALVAIGGCALVALLVRPERAGYAYQVLAVMTGVLLTLPVVGDPDNVGGQAGPIDPLLLVLTLPALVAALLAAPWRRPEGPWRPRLLLLAAAAGVPAGWYGIDQGLLQRNTFPPTADPHHNAHWWVMAIMAFTVVLVMAAGALPGRGWRLGTILAAVTAIGIGIASLAASASASALAPLGAVAAIAWGVVGLWLSLHSAVVRGAGPPELR